ncbi:MAG TPA: hypothetical protein VLA60_14840, partial [Nitrospirales bacterium]|nr:hypothetical protein [Nitrospirales bacterium]
STIPETKQETSEGATKEPISHLEFPSEPDTETTKSIQESTPDFLKTESIESFESKDLKKLLDSVDASETVTTPPNDPQTPFPTAPPASSSSESSQ